MVTQPLLHSLFLALKRKDDIDNSSSVRVCVRGGGLTCVAVYEAPWLLVSATEENTPYWAMHLNRCVTSCLSVLTKSEKAESAAMFFPPSMEPYITAASCSLHSRPTHTNTHTRGFKCAFLDKQFVCTNFSQPSSSVVRCP